MPAATMSWLAPTALGALGLLQQKGQADKANGLMAKGLNLQSALDAEKLAATQKMLHMADAYDPKTETDEAIRTAKVASDASIADALKRVTAEFAAGGGTPGTSSEFNVRAAGATTRAADPIRAFAVDRAGSEFARKQNAYTVALGAAPGNVSDSYFRAYQLSPQGDMTGSLSALLSGLTEAFKKKGGAGGSGDSYGGAQHYGYYDGSDTA